MGPKLLPPELLFETVLFVPAEYTVFDVFSACCMLHNFLLPRITKWIKMKKLFTSKQIYDELQMLREEVKMLKGLREEVKMLKDQMKKCKCGAGSLPGPDAQNPFNGQQDSTKELQGLIRKSVNPKRFVGRKPAVANLSRILSNTSSEPADSDVPVKHQMREKEQCEEQSVTSRTLNDYIRDNVYCPSTGCFVLPNGSEMTLENMIKFRFLNPFETYILDRATGTEFFLSEAIEMKIVDQVKGFMCDTSNNNETMNFKTAAEKGFIKSYSLLKLSHLFLPRNFEEDEQPVVRDVRRLAKVLDVSGTGDGNQSRNVGDVETALDGSASGDRQLARETSVRDLIKRFNDIEKTSQKSHEMRQNGGEKIVNGLADRPPQKPAPIRVLLMANECNSSPSSIAPGDGVTKMLAQRHKLCQLRNADQQQSPNAVAPIAPKDEL